MRPPRLITRALLRRGALVWLTMRLVVSAVMAFGGFNPFDAPASTMLSLVCVSIALVFVDIRLRHERMLIGNLGVGSSLIIATAASTAFAGEIAVRAFYAIAT